MTNPKAKVIVFGLNFNGYSIAKSLSDLGYEVLGVDFTRSVGSFSKKLEYCRIDFPVSASTLTNFFQEYSNENIDQSARSSNIILLPSTDYWIFCLSQFRDTVPEYFLKAYSDNGSILNLLNKDEEILVDENQLVLKPKRFNCIDAKHILLEGGRLCIKTSSKYIVEEGSAKELEYAHAFRFVEAESLSEFNRVCSEADDKRVPVIFQEVIPSLCNQMRTVGLCAIDGELLGLVYGEKIRGRPFQFGDCLAGKLTAVPPWAIRFASEFVEKYSYTGIAEIEFLEADGKFYLIEINPRSWSWVGATTISDAPLPKLLIERLDNLDECDSRCDEVKFNYQEIYFIKTLEDAQYFYLWSRLDKDGAKARMAMSPFRILCQERKYIADLDLYDLGPLFYAGLLSGKIFLDSLRDLFRQLLRG